MARTYNINLYATINGKAITYRDVYDGPDPLAHLEGRMRDAAALLIAAGGDEKDVSFKAIGRTSSYTTHTYMYINDEYLEGETS